MQKKHGQGSLSKWDYFHYSIPLIQEMNQQESKSSVYVQEFLGDMTQGVLLKNILKIWDWPPLTNIILMLYILSSSESCHLRRYCQGNKER
jgi:hypothetical protein